MRNSAGTPGSRVYRAPGRVNLIGEHTDYNGGFVLPAAIAYATRVTATRRPDRCVSVTSQSFSGMQLFDLDALESAVALGWSAYVRGMLIELQRDGAALCGVDLQFETDLPIGAGLSSSASLGVAAGFAMLDMSELTVDAVALARAAQRCENEHIGARVGIMDPFVCACAREGCAMLLDTRSLAYENVSLPTSAAFVVCNTMVKHDHATGGYNSRRDECKRAVAIVRKRQPQVVDLCDVSIRELDAMRDELGDVLFRRSRHVVSENARTVTAARALQAGDLEAFGRAMAASHESMRDDFEISAPEVETMIDLARAFGPSVLGARMTGGGFGGSTVNLVLQEAVAAFVRYIVPAYEAATGKRCDVYLGAGAAGASRVA